MNADRCRRWAGWLGLAVWMACGALGGAASPAPAPPNIVLILMDDLGAADGGCLGSTYYRTPHLDRLAASGMRFSQAYAACAVCSPTRAALQTGRYPARLHLTDWIAGEGTPAGSRFRVPDWEQRLPVGLTTLAEVLGGRGLRTGYVGKWHLGGVASRPQDHGFEVNIAGGAIGHPASYFWPYGEAGASHRVPDLAEHGGGAGEYLTDRLTEEAVRFMAANRDRPFFLQLAHYAVHSPLMGRPELVEAWTRRPGSRGQSNAVYAAMLESMDASVGRILRALDAMGLADHTVVVFTSDNGGAVHFGAPPATANPPLRMGKGYPYEGGLRVPLLIRAPGVTRAGAVRDVPVITQDLFPTLASLAGVLKSTAATALDGVDLSPVLRGRSRPARRDLFWHYPHYWNRQQVTPYSVIRSGDWKLIRFHETDREELYDLRSDPGEERDRAGVEPRRRRALAGRLDRWLGEVGAQMPVPRGGGGATRPPG